MVKRVIRTRVAALGKNYVVYEGEDGRLEFAEYSYEMQDVPADEPAYEPYASKRKSTVRKSDPTLDQE